MTHHATTAALLLALASASTAAQTPALTTADYDRAASRLAQNVDPLVDGMASALAWQDDGSVLFVLSDADGGRLLQADAGQSGRELVPRAALARALSRVADKPVVEARMLAKVSGLELRDAGRSLALRHDGQSYVCSIGNRPQCRKDDSATPADGDGPGLASPDGSREVFIRAHNLWLRERASGKETPLTSDGVEHYGYGTDNAGWARRKTPLAVWSPDSSRLVSFRHDARKVSTMTMVGTGIGAPEATQWRYPFVGDEHIFMIEPLVLDLRGDTPRQVAIDLPPLNHRGTICDHIACFGTWEDAQWSADGNTLAIASVARDHRWVELFEVQADSGATRRFFRHETPTQYESGVRGVNWRYLPARGEFLWYDTGSDWGHLVLHDLASGARKHAVTAGGWNVTQVARVDEDAGNVWFRAVGREAGRNPYYTHFYKASLDGGEPLLLSPDDGEHRIDVSKDQRLFVDTWSDYRSAPVSVLRSMDDGRALQTLAQADLGRLHASGWQPPEPFTVKARDGTTDLHGVMFKPSDFDASRRYPIVNYIYPGPQVGSVRTRAFAAAQLDHQALAELGFIVVAIDGMGTPLRSKAFQDAYYGDMGDNTLPDQVAAMRALALRHAWIDIDRAGIWGHSGGGNATAGALFRYPDFFKVGVAQAGNHDNRTYVDDWAERYHGLNVKAADGTSNYDDQANAAHAENLAGKLLLIHGMMDDNVPVQNTLLVVDALVKANKDFDLLILPHARHGFTGADNLYVTRRRWDYFVEHLLGATPPHEYRIAPAP
ncbi:MAG: prolyl oligopeptidase family serine peptidase [Pseudoxanthomonas suwonensis]|nr:prolyl oligopeptidase family serine peptidase [Pseudoxanthomonas suwonensis]